MAASRSRNWARWALGILIVLVVGAILFLFLAPRPVAVETAQVTTGPIAETVSDQGYARVREAYIVAAPVSGRLERVDLHVGDRVVAGASIIARIKPASADLLDPRAKAQAQAQISAAQAAVGAADAEQERLAAQTRKAEADLARVRALADKGFASRQALEAAEAEARAARASGRSASAQLAVRRSELAAARAALLGPDAVGDRVVTVTAPAGGYVTRVLQESERTVAMGAPLVEISDNAGLEAAIEFLSQDAVRVHEGMPAQIYDWGGADVLPAVVRRVEPQAFTKVSALGVEEQRVLVFLQPVGSADRWASLGPGYRLWGRVILRSNAQAVRAPVGALVRSDGAWAVFRVEKGRARLRPVKVGAITERDAEILGGLNRGDVLIVFPSDRIRDQVRVRTGKTPR
jgi:HlyD family secretion protein